MAASIETVYACSVMSKSKPLTARELDKAVEKLVESNDEYEAATDGDDISSGSEYVPTLDTNSQESTSSSEDEPAIPKRTGKKRQRKASNWIRNVKKRQRNTGKEYQSMSNKTIPAKTMTNVDDHKCRKKCTEKISADERDNLFKGFWSLGDFNMQNAYIGGCVTQKKPKQIRDRRNPEQSRRSVSCQYSFLLPTGNVSVCKSYFLGTLGVSDGRVTRCLQKQLTSDGVPSPDARGKHENRKKTSDEKINYIKAHIDSFPSYESHYTRAHQRTRKYLSPDLNIARMYALYLEKCGEDGHEPEKEWIYRRVFVTEFNLSFHQPRKDTCKTCDRLKVAIDNETNEGQKKQMTVDREIHLRKAEKVRTSLANERNNKDSEYTAFTFDLQSTLPTPKLSAGVVFYKRQLWTYNFGIHSMTDDNVIMYMWDESNGRRGANEIGSCLYRYVEFQSAKGVKKLTAYSDACGGQNRNIKIALFWSNMMATLGLEEINHKFMISGHSYLPNDQDFSVVERAKRSAQQIFIPDDWRNLVAKARKRDPFQVINMKVDDFKNSNDMATITVNRKKCTDGQDVKWQQIQWINFRRDDPLMMHIKYSTDEDAPFFEVDLKQKRARGRRVVSPSNVTLSRLYNGPLPINPLKYKDLMELLMFIPPVHHSFYINLKTSDNHANVISDQESEDE